MIGNTVLALTQIVVIGAASRIGLLVTDQAGVVKIVAPVAGWFVVFFVLGFVALAGLWAVAGSLTTRQEDLGSTTLPGQMILMIPFFFSVFAGSQAKAIASFVPIASSMSMPRRMLTEDVPVWKPLLAILVLLVATVLIVRVGPGCTSGRCCRRAPDGLSGGDLHRVILRNRGSGAGRYKIFEACDETEIPDRYLLCPDLD